MDDGLDPMGHQGVVQARLLAQIADEEALGGNRCPMAGGQVVVDPDVVAAGQEQPHRMAADVAGAACDENSHEDGP